MPYVYGFMASPPTRSVLLTAKLVGLDVTLKLINLREGEHKSKEYLKKNPTHSVPTFEDDDGLVLFDSHAIVTYIVNKYGKDDSLYPKDAKARAVVDNMLHFNNSCLWSAIRLHFLRSIFYDKPFNELREEAFVDRLIALNDILGERPYAAGDHITVADICILNSLNVPEVLGFQITPYLNIIKWMDKLKTELKFYDEVMVPGIEKLKCFLGDGVVKYKAFVDNKKSA